MQHVYIYTDLKFYANGFKCNEWLSAIKRDAIIPFKTLKGYINKARDWKPNERAPSPVK